MLALWETSTKHLLIELLKIEDCAEQKLEWVSASTWK